MASSTLRAEASSTPETRLKTKCMPVATCGAANKKSCREEVYNAQTRREQRTPKKYTGGVQAVFLRAQQGDEPVVGEEVGKSGVVAARGPDKGNSVTVDTSGKRTAPRKKNRSLVDEVELLLCSNEHAMQVVVTALIQH